MANQVLLDSESPNIPEQSNQLTTENMNKALFMKEMLCLNKNSYIEVFSQTSNNEVQDFDSVTVKNEIENINKNEHLSLIHRKNLEKLSNLPQPLENEKINYDKQETDALTRERENQGFIFESISRNKLDVTQFNSEFILDTITRNKNKDVGSQLNRKRLPTDIEASEYLNDVKKNQELELHIMDKRKSNTPKKRHKLNRIVHKIKLTSTDINSDYHDGEMEINQEKEETRGNMSKSVSKQTHNRKKSGKKTFSCGVCKKQYASAFQLMKHMLKHESDSDKEIKCLVCEKSYTSRGLRSHILRAHMPVPDTAIITLPNSESKSDDYETYIVSHDGRKAYKCKTCGEKFWYQNQVTKHVWKHTKVTPYQCPICGEYKRELGTLQKHIVTVHEGNLPQCPVCNKKFSSDRTLKNHVSLHTGEKSHECEICGEVFRLRMSLRRHQLNKHPGETSTTSKTQRSCIVCGRIFVNADNLKSHLYTHSDIKLFDCPICGRLFRQPCVRDQHQKTHSDEKSHMCNECGDVFKTSQSLKLHIKAQHGKKSQYICNECGKVFKYPSALSRHKVLHSGEKRYKCDACEKSFSTSYSLQCHIRSHAGVKLFGCDICDARFTQRENLNRHMKKIHKTINAKNVK